MGFGRLSGLSVLVFLSAACGDMDSNSSVDASSTSADASVSDARLDAMALPDAEPPIASACDPVIEETCPEGEKCAVVRTLDAEETAVTSVEFLCVPIQGNGGDGASCTRTVDVTPWDVQDLRYGDTCAHGLVCLDEDGSSTPRCRRVCVDRRRDCGEDAYCESYYDDPRFGYCAPVAGCDPVYQRGCAGGLACYPVADTRGDLRAICRVFSPRMDSDGSRGETCELLTECQPGLTCVLSGDVAASEARCERLCDVEEEFRPMTLGPGPGGCPSASDFCVAIPLDEGATSRLPVPLGICQ